MMYFKLWYQFRRDLLVRVQGHTTHSTAKKTVGIRTHLNGELRFRFSMQSENNKTGGRLKKFRDSTGDVAYERRTLRKEDGYSPSLLAQVRLLKETGVV
jgi:hypothetical protein